MTVRDAFLKLVLLPVAALSPLSAQQAPQRLTVAAAIDLAEKQNLDLAAARAKRAVALAGVRIAGERPNPTLSFGAARDTPHETALIDQPLEIGPKRERRIEVARQESALTEADISALERQLRRSVRDAFFGLAHARAVTAQQEGAVKLAERLHDIAKARFDAGDIPQLEVTQAELEAARAQANRQVAQQEEKVALSGLNALLNEPATTDWDLGDPFAALPPTPALEDVLARAGASNAEIARISQEAKIEQSRKALFEAERIPNLGLQFGADFNAPGGLGTNTGGYEVGAARPALDRASDFFAQSGRDLAIHRECARAGQPRLQRPAGRWMPKSNPPISSSKRAKRRRSSTVKRFLPSSRQLEEMAEESYRAGKANIMTVLGAQRDVRQVERDYLDSLLAVQSAFSQLEEAVGAPLD